MNLPIHNNNDNNSRESFIRFCLGGCPSSLRPNLKVTPPPPSHLHASESGCVGSKVTDSSHFTGRPCWFLPTGLACSLQQSGCGRALDDWFPGLLMLEPRSQLIPPPPPPPSPRPVPFLTIAHHHTRLPVCNRKTLAVGGNFKKQRERERERGEDKQSSESGPSRWGTDDELPPRDPLSRNHQVSFREQLREISFGVEVWVINGDGSILLAGSAELLFSLLVSETTIKGVTWSTSCVLRSFRSSFTSPPSQHGRVFASSIKLSTCGNAVLLWA